MKKRTGIVTTEEWLFLLCYGVWFFLCCFRNTEFRYLFPIVDLRDTVCWAAVPLLAVEGITGKSRFTPKRWFLALAFMALSVFTAYKMDSVSLGACSVWIVLAANKDKDRIFRLSFLIMLVCFVVTVSCALAGIIPNVLQNPIRKRWQVGYTYPSYPSHTILFLSLLIIVIRKKLTFPGLAALLAANFVIFRISGARVDFCIAMAVLPMIFIFSHVRLEVFMETCPWLFAAVPFILMAISFLSAYYYDENNRIFAAVNELLSRRLFLSHWRLETDVIPLFGQKMSWNIDGRYAYVDNYFLQTAFQRGILYVLFIVSGYAAAMKSFCIRHEKVIMLTVIAVMFHGLIDPPMGDLRWHPFLFLIARMFEEPRE